MNRLIRLGLVLIAAMVAVAGIAVAADKKQTTGTVWAGVTHQEGDNLIVAGDFDDSVLGKGAIVYVTTVGVDESGAILIKAKKITIYTRKGSLQGKGSAIQTINPDGMTASLTDGKFSLKKGTGKYEDHTLKGTFDGGYADGVYTFDYDAVYK